MIIKDFGNVRIVFDEFTETYDVRVSSKETDFWFRTVKSYKSLGWCLRFIERSYGLN